MRTARIEHAAVLSLLLVVSCRAEPQEPAPPAADHPPPAVEKEEPPASETASAPENRPVEPKSEAEPPTGEEQRKTVTSSVTGHEFELVENGWASDFEKRLDYHEPGTNKVLTGMALLCPRDAVIIDAGAHVGDTGLVLAKHLAENERSDVVVYQVDPDTSKIEFIEAMAALNGITNIATVRAGLSSKKGQGRAVEKGHPGGWRVRQVKRGDFPMTTVDALIESKRVCTIHLDVEGFEYRAVQGARRTLEEQRPPVIVELRHGPRDKITPYLAELGYRSIWGREFNELFVHRDEAVFTKAWLVEIGMLPGSSRPAARRE